MTITPDSVTEATLSTIYVSSDPLQLRVEVSIKVSSLFRVNLAFIITSISAVKVASVQDMLTPRSLSALFPNGATLRLLDTVTLPSSPRALPVSLISLSTDHNIGPISTTPISQGTPQDSIEVRHLAYIISASAVLILGSNQLKDYLV